MLDRSGQHNIPPSLHARQRCDRSRASGAFSRTRIHADAITKALSLP
jgi:hypothetical protein